MQQQPQFSFNDPERLSKIKQAIPSIDKIYQEYASNNHLPGYSYGIVVDGELLHLQCGGYADVAKKTPVTENTVFRIASLSKSFTAMAILKLRDAGKLKLDDPINIYVPELKSQALTSDSPAITIRDLLTHASGLPQDDPWGDRKLCDSTAEFLQVLKSGVHFSNTTGTTFEYSNLGYTILGQIINKASGVSFQEYISKNIWQPLGMQTSTWDYNSVPAADLAHGYKWEHEQWTQEPILGDGAFACMGGIMVSVTDFSKYVALHMAAWPARNDPDSSVISRSSLRSMHQPFIIDTLNTKYKLLDGTELGYTKGYSYGLAWLLDSQNKKYIFHPGSLPGYHAHWNMLPDYGIAVIVMGNIKNAPRFDVNMQALNTLVKEACLQPRELVSSPLLQQRQQALLKLLPTWQNATESDIFASNFFLDNSLATWQQQTASSFAKAGKILKQGKFIPENQLRGHFILSGENCDIKIKFTLAPEPPALIQEVTIETL